MPDLLLPFFLSVFFLAFALDLAQGKPAPAGLQALAVRALPAIRFHPIARLALAASGAGLLWAAAETGLPSVILLSVVLFLSTLTRGSGRMVSPQALELLERLEKEVTAGRDFFSGLAPAARGIPDGALHAAVDQALACFARREPLEVCLRPLRLYGEAPAQLAAGVRRAGWAPSRALEIVVRLARESALRRWQSLERRRLLGDRLAWAGPAARFTLAGVAAACPLLFHLPVPWLVIAVTFALLFHRSVCCHRGLLRFSALAALALFAAPVPHPIAAQAAPRVHAYEPAPVSPERSTRLPPVLESPPPQTAQADWIPDRRPAPSLPTTLLLSRAVVWNPAASGAYLWDRPGGRILRWLPNGAELQLTEDWQALGGVPFGEVILDGLPGWVDMRHVHRLDLRENTYMQVRLDGWIYLYDQPAGRILLWLPPGTPLLPAGPAQGSWRPVRLLIGDEVGWVKSAALTASP